MFLCNLPSNDRFETQCDLCSDHRCCKTCVVDKCWCSIHVRLLACVIVHSCRAIKETTWVGVYNNMKAWRFVNVYAVHTFRIESHDSHFVGLSYLAYVFKYRAAEYRVYYIPFTARTTCAF